MHKEEEATIIGISNRGDLVEVATPRTKRAMFQANMQNYRRQLKKL